MEIGHSTYDYAKELERHNDKTREAHRHRFREQVGDISEKAAHAIRKDPADALLEVAKKVDASLIVVGR